jgi:hypothetical protein
MQADADIGAIVDYLITERRRLEEQHADAAAREANRRALAYWQPRASARAPQCSHSPGASRSTTGSRTARPHERQGT